MSTITELAIAPITITLERWDCGRGLGHQHMTRQNAEKCLASIKSPRRIRTIESRRAIYNAFAKGQSVKSLAFQHDLSTSRIRGIVEREAFTDVGHRNWDILFSVRSLVEKVNIAMQYRKTNPL